MNRNTTFTQELCLAFRPQGKGARNSGVTKLAIGLLVWALVIGGLLSVTGLTIGTTLLLAVLIAGLAMSIQGQRECRALSRLPLPLPVRKSLYRDGMDYIWFGVHDYPVLRECQKKMHRRQLVFVFAFFFVGLLAFSGL